jgi:hypothetical protein
MDRPTTPTVPTTPSTAGASAPVKPKAFQKYIRGSDGKLRVVYVNEQGVQIPPIALQQGLYDFATNDVSQYYGQDQIKPQDESKQTTPKVNEGQAFVNSPMIVKQPRISDGARDSSQSSFDPNNTGYFDKPGWVGMTSALPGAAGMAGKALNAGINLGNHMAVNDARIQSGLAPRDGVMDTIRGIARDNQGQVADATINGQDYSIGVGGKVHGGGGLTPRGNTSLTPQEAHNRGAMFGINEIDKRDFGDRFKNNDIAGILSGAFSGLKDFFGGLMNPSASIQTAPEATELNNFQDQFDSVPGQVQNALADLRSQSNIGATKMPDQSNQPGNSRLGVNPSMGQFPGMNVGFVDLTPETPGSFPTPTTINPVSTSPLTTGATSSPITNGLTEVAQKMMPGFSVGGPTTPANQPGMKGPLGLVGLNDLGKVTKSIPGAKPGMGLISYGNIGPNRNNRVNASTEEKLAAMAGYDLGKDSVVDVISGDVNPGDPGWTADGGKYSRSHRHTDEVGADVKFTDPETGKAVNLSKDDVIRGDLAMGFAAMDPNVGLGFGNGYMGDETMHVDFSGKGGMWSPKSTIGWSDLDRANVAFARETGIGPTPRLDAPSPTARPDPDAPVADYSGGSFSKYGDLATANNHYDSPKEKNAASLSRQAAESAKATAGLRSEATESAKESASKDKSDKDKDKNDKSDKSESKGKSEGKGSDRSSSNSDKSEKSSASKESSKASKESKGKDHSKGGYNAD